MELEVTGSPEIVRYCMSMPTELEVTGWLDDPLARVPPDCREIASRLPLDCLRADCLTYCLTYSSSTAPPSLLIHTPSPPSHSQAVLHAAEACAVPVKSRKASKETSTAIAKAASSGRATKAAVATLDDGSRTHLLVVPQVSLL